MKKIFVFILVIALCATALSSCALVDWFNGFFENELDDINEMYSASAPTKVVATTTQKIGSLSLNCSYELITGYVDNKPASVYTVHTEEIRSVEDGGNNDEVKPLIKTTDKKTEAIEGFGSRTNGGDWNPQGTIWTIGRGSMAINLDEDYLEDISYENNVLTFTIPKDNAGDVLGDEFSGDISSDVEVTITDDGAVITSIELHYFLAANEAAHLVESEMTVKVVYTYDLERITIE